MSKNLMGIDDAARGDSMQDFLIDCAESEVPIEEAKRRFLEPTGSATGGAALDAAAIRDLLA